MKDAAGTCAVPRCRDTEAMGYYDQGVCGKHWDMHGYGVICLKCELGIEHGKDQCSVEWHREEK